VTLKLKLRKDHTIVLWGPAKHDKSYVSVPALTLQRGDRVQVSIVDRRLFGDRALGVVHECETAGTTRLTVDWKDD